MEGLAALEAVPRLTEKDLTALEKYATQLEKYSKEKKTTEYEKANVNFHSVFWKAADNKDLRLILQNIYVRVKKFRSITRRYPERFKDFVGDHRHIQKAAQAKNAGKAEYIVALLEKNTFRLPTDI